MKQCPSSKQTLVYICSVLHYIPVQRVGCHDNHFLISLVVVNKAVGFSFLYFSSFLFKITSYVQSIVLLRIYSSVIENSRSKLCKILGDVAAYSSIVELEILANLPRGQL